MSRRACSHRLGRRFTHIPVRFQLWAVNYPNIDANCDNLTPGTTICLGWPGVDCTTNYVVQLGDTCDGVASQWGINTTILYANNPQLDQNYCDNLYVGEVGFPMSFSSLGSNVITRSFALPPLSFAQPPPLMPLYLVQPFPLLRLPPKPISPIATRFDRAVYSLYTSVNA